MIEKHSEFFRLKKHTGNEPLQRLCRYDRDIFHIAKSELAISLQPGNTLTPKNCLEQMGRSAKICRTVGFTKQKKIMKGKEWKKSAAKEIRNQRKEAKRDIEFPKMDDSEAEDN